MITIFIQCQFLEHSQSLFQAINKNSQLGWNMFSLQARVWRKQKIMAYWLECIQHHHLISLLSCVCSANSAELSKLSQASAASEAPSRSARGGGSAEEKYYIFWRGGVKCVARHITHLLSKAIGRDMHASMPQAQWLTKGEGGLLIITGVRPKDERALASKSKCP